MKNNPNSTILTLHRGQQFRVVGLRLDRLIADARASTVLHQHLAYVIQILNGIPFGQNIGKQLLLGTHKTGDTDTLK